MKFVPPNPDNWDRDRHTKPKLIEFVLPNPDDWDSARHKDQTNGICTSKFLQIRQSYTHYAKIYVIHTKAWRQRLELDVPGTNYWNFIWLGKHCC